MNEPRQHSLFESLPNPHAEGSDASSRYEQMRAAAVAFHEAHPRVWLLFLRFTFDRIDKGYKAYSVNAIFERIRWETGEAQVDPEQEFKLNNNHRAFYARAFMHRNPSFAGFFRTREQTSKAGAPAPRPELGPGDFLEDGRA
jgi:hypothetical protein